MTAKDRRIPQLSLDESRARLLRLIEGDDDVTFVRGYGNVGDDLIQAGTRRLLSGRQYREVGILDPGDAGGHTALLSGSGGWCRSYHPMPRHLQEVESRFERVILLPSSFDVSVEEVRRALSCTKAKVFAREAVSYDQIRDLCDADLAHDCALYFEYRPYQREGKGVLTAYRSDREAARRHLPPENHDISATCESLDEFLWTIARHELVRTDRAHVTIAAAMLGKQVEYAASNYHKVPAIVAFSLGGLPVRRVGQPRGDPHDADAPREVSGHRAPAGAAAAGYRHSRREGRREHLQWLHDLRRAREEIESLVPPGDAFLFVDDGKLGREPVPPGRRPIPFLEKDGVYWGPPADDAAGIAELERLRQSGANFLVFAWPAFWWLDHYPELRRHVESRYRRIWRNQRLHVFDLR